jgi:hypothetical protein
LTSIPEVRILAGDPPQCFVDGRPVEARGEKVQLGERTVFVLDLVRLWAKQPGRTQSDIDEARAYIAYHLDLMRCG